MTTKRIDGLTPAGGDYSVAVYVKIDTLEEVDEDEADGMVISEYTDDGTMLRESVGKL